MLDSSVLLYWICTLNPFTHGVELIRFSLYAKFNWLALAVVVVSTLIFFYAAVIGYDPTRGSLAKKGS